jgi:hypothetical protein
MTEPQQLIPLPPPAPTVVQVLGAGDLSTIYATTQQMVSLATSFMTSLQYSATGSAPLITPDFPTVTAAPTLLTAGMPALVDVAWTVPTQPGAFGGIAPNVSSYLPGPFQGIAPSLVFGALPVSDYGAAPDAPAIDLNFTMPTLSITLPVPPQLMSLNSVTFNGVTLPTLDVTVPQLTAVAPNIMPYQENGVYVSTLLTSLQADLSQAITDGTYLSLDQQVQAAMWDAAREREYRAQADALADLERMEVLGMAFPPGVYLDARLKIQTETQNTTAGLSRDIMVKQAQLQLDNLTKAREQATALEGKLMDYTNNMAQRAFESAKFVAESAIQIYNANVEAYKANLQGFTVQAQIFDTKMKGAQVQVDIYKTEIEAEKAQVEMNTQLVEQYKAQASVQMMFVDIYKAELGAIETQANLQKIIVEAYSEQIKAYVAKINAFSAQVEAYKASVESQGVVENVYKTQVDAYAATVNAGAQEATAVIEGFKAQVSAYTAQLDGYKAAVTGMAEEARAAAEHNQAAADVYKAEIQGISSYNEVLTKEWEATMNISEKIAEVAITAAKANGDLYIANKNAIIEAEKGGAQVAAQLGAAALNAIHFSNSASWSSSTSYSLANSVSNSYSGVDSYSQSVSA